MASIARKNLLDDLPRFLVAQAGIMFAVSLVTIQTGLQFGFAQSSSRLIDQSQADLWVSDENMQHLRLTRSLSYEQVLQARDVEGVAEAEPIIIEGVLWYDADADEIASFTAVGADPEGLLFNPDNLVAGSYSDLEDPYTFITDETNLDSLNLEEIGEEGEANAITMELVGLSEGTQSVVIDNLTFTSVETANILRQAETDPTLTADTSTPPIRELTETDPVTFVLVRAEPGVNLDELQQRIEDTLPDTRAYTREEMALRTQLYWQQRSGIGFILGLGAAVGVIVGVVVVGQILYASVTDHLKEFGTLKAMGASNRFIYRVIAEQGLWMAILGYIPGMGLCLGVSAWTAATQGIAVLITPGSAIAVLALTVVMCVSSSIFAIQKVTRVDPGIVFK
jgi:putative ABC transport system permease protein